MQGTCSTKILNHSNWLPADFLCDSENTFPTTDQRCAARSTGGATLSGES